MHTGYNCTYKLLNHMYTVKLATKILLVTCKIQTIKRTKQQNLPLPEVRVKRIIAMA